MGWAQESGRNVPSWLVDATSFGELLTRLNSALQRPPSFSGSVNPSLLAYNRSSIRDSIVAVAESAEHTHLGLRQALAGFETASIDRAHQARLTSLVNELTTLWSVRATMTLGVRRSAEEHALCKKDASPDRINPKEFFS
jgi:hypothetical protein